MKINALLNIDKVAEYTVKNPAYLYKSEKSAANYGKLNININAGIQFHRYDVNLSIPKPKDSQEKRTYIGNGQSDLFESKKQFEKETVEARMKGQTITNPFSDGWAIANINLTDVKEFLKKNPKAKNQYGEIPILIYINSTCDNFGNDVQIKTDIGTEDIYIGNGKTPQAFNETKNKPATSPEAEEPKKIEIEIEGEKVEFDDLPW